MNHERTDGRGLALGIVLIAVAAGLLLAATAAGLQSGPLRKGLGTVLGGLYIQYLGLLFLLAYFSPHKSFLFRALIWVCEHFSRPRGRWMAFFYFGLAFVLGGIAVLHGLGLLK